MKITVLLCVKQCHSAITAIIARTNFQRQYRLFLDYYLSLNTQKTMHKMYPDGGRKLARSGMRNKLFILHGLMKIYLLITSGVTPIRSREAERRTPALRWGPRGPTYSSYMNNIIHWGVVTLFCLPNWEMPI